MKLYLFALLRWLVTATLVLCACMAAVVLWHRYEDMPWTRDGYIDADIVKVAPDVSGLVTEVDVHDNERVKRGQLLFVVDRPRYQDALAEAKATIAVAQANYDQAKRVANRDRVLGNLVATETREEDDSKVLTTQGALESAIAAESTASLNLSRTNIYASVNGLITNLSLRPGDYLGAGTQAFAMIDLDSLRIEAYLEETKLAHVEVGNKVKARLMGSSSDIIGHVESIAGGVAQSQLQNTSNLLPAVNPTFTWVRLAQRIPVRVHIDQVPDGTKLIVGRTVTVTIEPTLRSRGEQASENTQ